MASTPPMGPDPHARRLSKPATIGIGLLLTFVGLFLLSILLPDNSGRWEEILPVAAAGMLFLWVGGILMGRGGRP
ncbi:MAG TPA: hypothetical protein VMG99_02105 [Thermoplasmata archaeon]|nr:hypothetical protein [Thermoplasmata archaeon]